jgi:hypothetical protein
MKAKDLIKYLILGIIIGIVAQFNICQKVSLHEFEKYKYNFSLYENWKYVNKIVKKFKNI